MNSEPFPAVPILIVDDEEAVIRAHSRTLKSAGINNLLGCQDARDVMGHIRSRDIEAVLLDLTMPHVSGQKLLREIQEDFPHLPVIVVTASNEVEAAVECLQAGAFDYMVKAVEPNRLVSGVRRAIEIRELKRKYSELRAHFLKDELSHPEAFSSIITRDRKMKSIFLYIESVANSSEPVLILGETAVGKELIARAVHEASERTGSFVAVSVAGLDDQMFSDTLFGHLRGAFTDAREPREGLIQQAKGGTLFLDEIGDLSVQSQVKLLRLLSTREYFPLGSDLAKRSDARIVLATNRDLAALMGEEKFRKDLYFRLSTYEIEVPPLRERKEDLPLLLDHFLAQAAAEHSRDKPPIPAQLVPLLENYDYPGNILELRNMIFAAVAKSPADRLSLQPFKEYIFRNVKKIPTELKESLLIFTERLPTPRQARDLLFEEALRRAKGDESIAAMLVGVSRQAINKWKQRRKKEQPD